jgi:hypothetical protein
MVRKIGDIISLKVTNNREFLVIFNIKNIYTETRIFLLNIFLLNAQCSVLL